VSSFKLPRKIDEYSDNFDLLFDNFIMESEEGRYKGIRKDDGKIIKGTLTEAPLKLRASSIPSKTENVIYSNHHKSAFGNSQ
jgi:hypothetical protein